MLRLGADGGSGGAQERSVLQDSAMECYIPHRPLAVADLDAFFTAEPSKRPPTRRYVLQGEQLQLYLLVRPSVEAASAADPMRVSSLSQLSVKVHFAEASTMKGILMLEKKKPRIMDDHPHINSVVSDPIAPYLTVLSNGSFLYAVNASMAVKDEYCNKLFHIVVTVALPSTSEAADLPADDIRSILSAAAVVDRSPSRTFIHEVELQQPLAVSFTRVVASSRTIVRIAAENRHSTLPLWIYDLQFLKDYTKMAREAGGSPVITHTHKLSDSSRMAVSSDQLEAARLAAALPRDSAAIENLNFKEYFNIILEAETFPIKLAPGDEFCFIASIEPLPGAYAKFFALKTRNFDSNVLLTWGMEATQGRMLSSYDLHWSAPECREFLLSVSCKSPVLRNSVFPVCFTVTNLSSETQDLVITIGEQEAGTVMRRLADSNVENSVISAEASSELGDAASVGKRPILCFQHAVELGPVKAANSVSVNVQYVALRDGVAQISELQIVDKISRRIFKTKEVCEVYVMSPDDWRGVGPADGTSASPVLSTLPVVNAP